jgi:threonine dehydrogenase-like Zn-dependent dehydrogenase
VEVAKAYGATDVVNYKVAPVEDQILELTGGQGVDAVIIAGGNSDILVSAVKMVKPGGKIANINYFGEGETLPLPRLEWGSGMSHKAINGGLTPGGRLRMEKLVSLYEYGRIAPEKLVTHVFEGFEHIEEALMLMKDKPKDLIKPVVLI